MSDEADLHAHSESDMIDGVIVSDFPVENASADQAFAIKTEIKPSTFIEHVCGICSKAYTTSVGLRRHMRFCQGNTEEVEGLRVSRAKRLADAGLTEYDILDEDAENLSEQPDGAPLVSVLDAQVDGEDVKDLALKIIKCDRCQKTFTRKYHLDRHILQTGCDGTSRPGLPCNVCGRLFTRKDNLREHLRGHMGESKRKKLFECPQCSRTFQGASVFTVHMRTHSGERPFQCEHVGCGSRFSSNAARKKHERMHTGERPYMCKQCFAQFAAKETLNRHMRTHTGEKPHRCEFCGKSFIQAGQLRAHVFHHTGQNGYQCPTCDKAFNRRTRLTQHIRFIHEGEKPLPCTVCERTFIRKEDLARHLALHTGIKNFTCNTCNKAFATNTSLRMHIKIHTSEEPRACFECGRAFIRQDCLIRHMRLKHRDQLEEILAGAERKKLQETLLAAMADSRQGRNRGERLDRQEENNAGIGGKDRSGGKVDSGENGDLDMQVENAADTDVTEIVDERNVDTGSNDEDDMLESGCMSENKLRENVGSLLSLLVDEETLSRFGWPDAPVDKVLDDVINRCGHYSASAEDYDTVSRLRENTKRLFTVVIDDSAVKSLLNNHTVDEVVLHILKLSKQRASFKGENHQDPDNEVEEILS